jgi:mercuric ion transport protein
LAAITASLCCLGPVVVALLGLGSFGAAAFFETWRPYFLGLAFVLLAGAFYLTYRRREMVCADGTCRVSRAPRWNKALLWVATVVIVLLAAFPYYSGSLLVALDRIQGQQPATQASVTDLKEFGQVGQLFQSDSGKVRVISLLSPT